MFTTRSISKTGDFEARNIVTSVGMMGQKPSATGENILPILVNTQLEQIGSTNE
jgi:hypothetical protein